MKWPYGNKPGTITCLLLINDESLFPPSSSFFPSKLYLCSEFGYAEYRSAVEEAGEDQTGKLYRRTEVLNVIGAIAPMLGLTGTVLGMIEAFTTIASLEGMARPQELAGGIGQALITTLLGLLVAIPTMVAFSYFRNKIDSLVAEAGKRIEQIMMPLGRKK